MKRVLLIWLVIATVWPVVCPAEVGQIRICLPAGPTNELPSDEFINAINTAVTAGKTNTFSIASTEPFWAKSAKVILHSYGIGEARIQFAITTNDCPPAANSRPAAVNPTAKFQTVFVVLGNLPLDDSTPTVDMLQRLFIAIPNVKGRPGVALVLTGAATAGPISEARMMALVALSRGVKREQIILEEESWTTGRNAALTAPIVERLGAKSIFIVSKKSHLAFAMRNSTSTTSTATRFRWRAPNVRAESIRQMAEYLKLHNTPGIETRMEALKADSHGVD